MKKWFGIIAIGSFISSLIKSRHYYDIIELNPTLLDDWYKYFGFELNFFIAFIINWIGDFVFVNLIGLIAVGLVGLYIWIFKA